MSNPAARKPRPPSPVELAANIADNNALLAAFLGTGGSRGIGVEVEATPLPDDEDQGPVEVCVEGQPALGEGWAAALRADAQRLLSALGHEGAELSIVLCDDAFIQPLNRDWRDKDQPTDVLSFPQSEDHAPEGGLLGDLVISVETAAAAAARLGHRVEEELQVLLVHGLLHLLGFDHEKGEDEAARMRAEEQRLLSLLGGRPGLISRVEAEADGAGPVG